MALNNMIPSFIIQLPAGPILLRFMITERLIRHIQDRFPHLPVKFAAPPDPIAVFPAAHPDVGDIEIFDDDDEITVYLGKFTHTHLFHDLSSDQSQDQAVKDIGNFLERILKDEIVLWGSHQSSGGFHPRGSPPSKLARPPFYVWSGPLTDK